MITPQSSLVRLLHRQTQEFNYLQDLYAMQLFLEEKQQNPLDGIDYRLTWAKLPQADRDVYRDLASRLIKENPV